MSHAVRALIIAVLEGRIPLLVSDQGDCIVGDYNSAEAKQAQLIGELTNTVRQQQTLIEHLRAALENLEPVDKRDPTIYTNGHRPTYEEPNPFIELPSEDPPIIDISVEPGPGRPKEEEPAIEVQAQEDLRVGRDIYLQVNTISGVPDLPVSETELLSRSVIGLLDSTENPRNPEHQACKELATLTLVRALKDESYTQPGEELNNSIAIATELVYGLGF
jgi:uncharacterized coiled-coil protein SlyX